MKTVGYEIMSTSNAYKTSRNFADQVMKKIQALKCPIMVFVNPKTKECTISKTSSATRLSMLYKDVKMIFLGCYDQNATKEWIMDDFSVTIKN